MIAKERERGEGGMEREEIRGRVREREGRENMSMEAREHMYLERWLETNKMKFKKVLYLEGEKKISVQVQDWGNLI